MPSDEWVADHWGLVRRAAREIAERHKLERFLDDLVAFGGEGLLEAHARYDASKGTAFSTFAWYHIRGRIIDGCRSMGLASRRGRNALWAEKALAAVRLDELEDPLERSESLTESLERMVTVAGVIHLLGEDADEESMLVCPAPTPEEVAETLSIARWVRHEIAHLDTVHRDVLVQSFFEDRTLDEIAERHGCTRSWASRLRSTALDHIRRRLIAGGWQT